MNFWEKMAVAGLDGDFSYFNEEVVPYLKRKSIGSSKIKQPERYDPNNIKSIPITTTNGFEDAVSDARAFRNNDGSYEVVLKDGIQRRNEQAAHEFRHAMHDSSGSGGNRTDEEDKTLDKAYNLNPEAIRMVYGPSIDMDRARRLAREEQGAINAEYQWRSFADQRNKEGKRPTPEQFESYIKGLSAHQLRDLRMSSGGVYDKLTISMPRLREIMTRHGISSSPGVVSDVLWRGMDSNVDADEVKRIKDARQDIDNLYRSVNDNPWDGVDIGDEQVEHFRNALRTAQNGSHSGVTKMARWVASLR